MVRERNRRSSRLLIDYESVMKLSLIKFFALFLSTAAIAGGWYWIEHHPGGGADGPGGRGLAGPARVTTARVEMREFRTRVESVGTVRAAESTDISANVTETVEALLFDDGDVATNGQILARLSSEEEQAALAAAEASLAEHEREIRRISGLVTDGAASDVRLQARRTLAEVTRQRIREAKATLRDRTITAPFDGLLGLRRISPGALVTPGAIITTLDRIDTVKLDFTVPEVFMGELKPGLRIIARSSAYPDLEFEGRVETLDSRVDPVTRAITVRATFPNPEYRLRPGMLLTTTLEGSPRRSPSVPERAIVSSGRRHAVFVISGPDGDQGTALQQPVELGRRIPGFVEVRSGLEAGQQIAADGLLGLRDGSSVEIIGSFEGPVTPFDPIAEDAGPAEPS